LYDGRPDQAVKHWFNMPALVALFICLLILAGCWESVLHDAQSLFFPHLQRSEIIGLVAGFGTTFAAVPDLIAIFRRRSTKGMNPRMAAIMGVFQILWVYYGLLILSRPVVLWNIIAVATNFFSVGTYYYFTQREGK
jgi:MtN3 and saliva related transmembrane protein